MILQMMIFFKDNVSKDMYKFSKREGMYKRFFQWFSNVSKFTYKGIFFNGFFQCLFKKYVQIFFSNTFYEHSKGFFNDFF